MPSPKRQQQTVMFIPVVRVSSGFLGFDAFISGMPPLFHLTIMVPPDESNS
jgi:hypothetical protein